MSNTITVKMSDVINIDEMMYYRNKVSNLNHYAGSGDTKLFVLHDHGFVITAVCADNLQDALDEAVDNHKLDSFIIEEQSNTPGTTGLPASDYPTLGTENEGGITRL